MTVGENIEKAEAVRSLAWRLKKETPKNHVQRLRALDHVVKVADFAAAPYNWSMMATNCGCSTREGAIRVASAALGAVLLALDKVERPEGGYFGSVCIERTEKELAAK